MQLVPVTESQGRIHTSAATIAVLPEAYDIEVKIDDRYGPYGDNDGIARVVVTAYWPRARGGSSAVQEVKKTQQSVKLVSFIRYNKTP